MQDQLREFDLTDMCEALALSRSGYYRWAAVETSQREQFNRLVKEQIQTIHHQARARYGYRPDHAHLLENGAGCGRDRTLRLMRELGLHAQQEPRDKPCGSESNHLFGHSPTCSVNWAGPNIAIRFGWPIPRIY